MTFHNLISDDATNKDLKINVKKIFLSEDDHLLDQPIHQAITLAVSLSLQNNAITEAAYAYSEDLDEKMQNAAKIAASTMAMNNIFYRATHLIQSTSLIQQPAGLRMQGISQHGIDASVFELMSLAISAINGCGMCLQSHYKQLQPHFSDAQITEALRIASVLHALQQERFIQQTTVCMA